MKANETEVIVIDAPHRAALALEAYRPRHERSHLICRWPDELMPAFARRVSARLGSIRRGAEVAALTLVLGSDPDLNQLLPELGAHLAAAIAPAGSLTLMGIGASQSDLVGWFDALRDMVHPSVTLGAWFPQLLVA
jgi:hypothetical protein